MTKRRGKRLLSASQQSVQLAAIVIRYLLLIDCSEKSKDEEEDKEKKKKEKGEKEKVEKEEEKEEEEDGEGREMVFEKEEKDGEEKKRETSLTVCNIFNSMGPTVLRIVRLVHGSVSSNHWSCRASRFFTFAPSIVLILHEVVMSIERYYSLFEPMSVCSTKAVEKMLAGAWAGGVMLTLGLVSSATIVQVDLGHNLYSTACRQALDTMVMKIIFYVSVIMAFVIPAILMFTIAIKVKRFLKQRRQRVEEGKPEFLDRAYAWRLKDAQMLVSIVLTFLVPYALIFFYGVILLITKVDLDFYFSFSILNISGVLAFSNCISIPLVCLVKNRQFREIAWQMLSCQP
ncbi:predicted protein [Nematostella vectensis]|uniref:G-protein coupled receptors family 1 profile domain-containing protein n=1 Tax=Nematostella vectensis TaxID=45351 RepID=A7SRL8_NEMVE|nr:predicted protein [Nematostella vectensis]|eukprot:XP_001625743.1 predicted protein [Nematostella vectensis]